MSKIHVSVKLDTGLFFRTLLVVFLCYSSLPLHGTSFSQERGVGNVDVILVVDLSKSMRGVGGTADIFSRVKETCKNLISELEAGDTVTLIPFSDEARALPTITLYGNAERQRLYEMIDDLDAEGDWTYTAEALRLSLTEASRLDKSLPDHRKVVFILTDGRNDPPPDADYEDGYVLPDLAIPSSGQPWYVYQVQYGDAVDENLEEVLSGAPNIAGGTIQDQNAQGGVDSLRSALEETSEESSETFSWNLNPSSVELELESPQQAKESTVTFSVPGEGAISDSLLTLDRSTIPSAVEVEYAITSGGDGRAELRISAEAAEAIQNDSYQGTLRIAFPKESTNMQGAPLEIPISLRTSMMPPTWPWWLGGFGVLILLVGGGFYFYGIWQNRQLFGTLKYWPSDDPSSSTEVQLGELGASAVIGTDISIKGAGEIGRLSTEDVDGSRLVVVRPQSRTQLKHNDRTVTKLALYNRDTFKLGEWKFRYTGATGRRPRDRKHRRSNR